MTVKFTKGGILNSSQLEDISNKKWKKGGILSATQLNELAGGESANKKEITITVTEKQNNKPTKATVSSNRWDDIINDAIANVNASTSVDDISVTYIDNNGDSYAGIPFNLVADSEYHEIILHFAIVMSAFDNVIFSLVFNYNRTNPILQSYTLSDTNGIVIRGDDLTIE